MRDCQRIHSILDLVKSILYIYDIRAYAFWEKDAMDG